MARLVVYAVLIFVSLAAPVRGAEDLYGDKWQENDYSGRPWEEGVTEIPAMPEEGDLLRLDIDHPRYRYFIDRKSLSIGRTDDVARYTVVIESPSGARSVFFEGIRCSVGQYKTYAYASGDGALEPMPRPQWRRVEASGIFRYRGELAEYYLCDRKVVRGDVGEIVQAIRYPSHAYNPVRDD